ncbi:MAG: UDP-N-acetylglucosamine 1-carboxyvinyltransferase [Acidobacteria bacterium]|nr:UDP-N-acetylglucosamine 1-carboxyvinyltransferase [Acidobacteriota bacterium]MCB9397404.1 UDP-N-acetylglucosamine 1-carboxyvinyltransferase [Acidobacteriota bacterium]
MAKIVITGNGPLKGQLTVHGAKNAALPHLAASILAQEPVQFSNMPRVADIETMCTLLEAMGLGCERSGSAIEVLAKPITSHVAPYELVKMMRASILVLGPLLARLGKAQVALPGGCAIGARPVDLHLKGLEAMGAEISLEHGYIDARCSRLQGADIYFEKVSVTGTENLMMAATLAEGTTHLRNAAREPEVVDLAELLTKMGAKIEGAGSDHILIHGVSGLSGCAHEVIPDRIEAGTYICAAAMTRGHLRVQRCRPDHLEAFLDTLNRMGVPFETGADWVEVLPHQGLKAVDVQTHPHPGFPTDIQAQLMALATQAEGRSFITENIFENRFMHAVELQRMGAKIKLEGKHAIVSGPTQLSGAEVRATDLRASACLLVAALCAEGQTIIEDIHHLDRGYEAIDQQLKQAGAIIERQVD